MEGLVFGNRRSGTTTGCGSPSWGAGRVLSVAEGAEPRVEAQVQSFPDVHRDFLPDEPSSCSGVLGRPHAAQAPRPTASWSPHADLAPVATKPWNNIVVDSRSNAFVDSVGFDFPGSKFAPQLVGLVTPSERSLPSRTGSPCRTGCRTVDRATLVVAEFVAEQLTAYTIADDGTLAEPPGLGRNAGDHPDGVCLDATGAAWYANVGNRRCVRVREGGETLDAVDLDRTPSPLAGPWPRAQALRHGPGLGRPGRSRQRHRWGGRRPGTGTRCRTPLSRDVGRTEE